MSRVINPNTSVSLRAAALSAVLSVSLALSAMAAPVTLKRTPQTDLTVSQPVEKMGRLLLPQGMFRVRGQSVEVQAVPDWLFDRHPVLKGKLLQVAIRPDTAATQTSSLDLLVYFNDGDWLKELYKGKRTREIITLKSGDRISGNVRSVGDEALNIETMPGSIRKIDLNDITAVDSPYAYRVSVGLSSVKIAPDTQDIAAEGTAVQFAPALSATGRSGNMSKNQTAVLPESNLAGTEGGITKSKIAAMVAVDTVNTLAPIVAIPIVIPLGQRSATKALNLYHQADILNSTLNLPPVPTAIPRF